MKKRKAKMAIMKKHGGGVWRRRKSASEKRGGMAKWRRNVSALKAAANGAWRISRSLAAGENIEAKAAISGGGRQWPHRGGINGMRRLGESLSWRYSA